MTDERPTPSAVPFAIPVPDEEIEDLHRRLAATRWPEPWPGVGDDDWSTGTPIAEIRRLAEHWRTGFDWRKQEREIVALPWGTADIEDVRVHYLRFDAETDGALPVVVTNGWPSSFVELVALARRLAEPSQSGGSREDALTVVVPCLPGFTGAPQQPGLPGRLPTHELWHRLMHDHLGFERYGAAGGDLGALTTTLLGQDHPESVVGIHLMAVADPPSYDEESLSDDERTFLGQRRQWLKDEGAYQHQHRTRPGTLGLGLSDSPVGLLAWITEKYWAWSDNDGRLSAAFSDDDVLTQASLYWFTNCISTSLRPYYEREHDMVPGVQRVDVPTAVALFPHDLMQPPRSWVERTYQVARFTTMPRGGHFAPHETPDLLADDLAAFFGTLR